MFQPRTLRLLILAMLGLAGPALATPGDPLPRPERLEPNVRFWLRIYTEVDGRGGLIHDSENLDVVYEVVRFPAGLGNRARERRVEKVKKRYRAALQRLAQGRRSGLSELEARVLSLWPEGTSNATLGRAARRVRFQLGQADKFRAGLVRAGNWSDYIQRVLDEHGVPPQLVALPHVESSYNPRAYSRVGAAGIWQFTRSTGRRYLRVDHVVDERMDPFAATVGAARLLRDNHRRLESWPLAITAYNHGVGGMARAVRKLGTRDIAEISRRYRSRTFGFASRNFYAEFLAADQIHRSPERYFGPLQPDPPVAYAILETDHYYRVSSLERALGIDRELLRDHNLALRTAVWNEAKLVPRGFRLRIPAERLQEPPERVLARIPETERIAQQRRDRFHKVRRGETLSRIARRYEVSVNELVALNNLRSRHRIRVGQVLRLPDDGTPVVVARQPTPTDGIYRVRRGDNLSIISQRFGVTQQDLVAWNRLVNRNQLAVGQRLRVAPPTTVVARADTQMADAAPTAAPASTAPAEGLDAKPVPEQQLPAEPERADPVDESPVESLWSWAAVHVPAFRDDAPTDALDEEALEVEGLGMDEPQVDGLEPAAPEVDEVPAKAAVEPEPPPGAVLLAAAPGAARPSVPVPDPSNYAVTPDERVTVQAEETLGHYAEWLEVSASRLRRINGMQFDTPLVIGRQKKLDFSRVTPEVFEQRRLEYHRTLQEEFFEAYSVSGTRTHVLRRGDSLWYLANRRYEVPMWLLRQYNPDLDFGALHPGTRLVVPVIETREQNG
jgi:membrane-bound lytic murein transglycosylase D